MGTLTQPLIPMQPMLAMVSPMPTTLFPILTLLAHQLSPTPCPLSPMLITQVFMVSLMVAFTAMDFPQLPLPKRLNARSVRLTLSPTPRLTLRLRLLLMPGTDTTDVPAIMVDTTAVDTMEAGEDITDTLTDTDTDTDGANRQKQITS